MRKFILFLMVPIFFTQSCIAQQALSTPTINATTTPPIEEVTLEMPTMPSPSMTIDPMRQRGKLVTVFVGDIFAISVPQGSPKWKVDYAGSVVEPLTPVENMEEPGSQGWFFRAIATGQTDIRLTSHTPPCESSVPCPPAPPIVFVFTLEVK